jgi:O-methyltransferase
LQADGFRPISPYGPRRRPWYALWRLIERALYRGREYTLAIPSGHLVYTPWFGADRRFARIFAEATSGGQMVVPAERCYTLYQFVHHALRMKGAFVECGTYRGGTAQLIAASMRDLASPTGPPLLHLFDTFAGMPDIAVPSRDYNSPGDHADTSLAHVRARLGPYPFVRFHVGLMPGTFQEVADITSFAFVHVDTDIYPSVLACCDWFWPRLSPGGVMVFDDYGFYAYRTAARAAVDDYFEAQGCRPIVLASGQAVAIRAGDGQV